MDVLFKKEQKLCVTCAYWDGLKQLNEHAIKADFIYSGKCKHPLNVDIGECVASQTSCREYLTHAILI